MKNRWTKRLLAGALLAMLCLTLLPAAGWADLIPMPEPTVTFDAFYKRHADACFGEMLACELEEEEERAIYASPESSVQVATLYKGTTVLVQFRYSDGETEWGAVELPAREGLLGWLRGESRSGWVKMEGMLAWTWYSDAIPYNDGPALRLHSQPNRLLIAVALVLALVAATLVLLRVFWKKPAKQH